MPSKAHKDDNALCEPVSSLVLTVTRMSKTRVLKVFLLNEKGRLDSYQMRVLCNLLDSDARVPKGTTEYTYQYGKHKASFGIMKPAQNARYTLKEFPLS